MAGPFPLDAARIVPRWAGDDWADGSGRLHVVSDLAIGLAFLAIPLVLVAVVVRRRDLPFPGLFWLLAVVIALGGATHLLGAVTVVEPVDRLGAAVKMVAAAAAWVAVAALVAALPRVAVLPSPPQLERELADQREWFRVVLASIGDAVVATGADHRVAFLNPAAEALTGWPAGEAVGRPLDEVVRTLDEDTRAAAESPVARVLREGAEVGLANHTLLVTRGGEERIVERSAAPIRGRGGSVLGVVLAVRDVTDRKRSEATRARLAAVVEGTADAVIGESRDGVVQTWNPAAERLYGWAAAEMVGRPVDVLVPPEKSDELAGVKARLGAGELVPPFETVRVTKAGRRVDVSVTLSPVRGPDGRVVGYSKIVKDVTARKRAEAALRLRDRAVAAASQGILITDPTLPDNPVVYASPGFERLTGYPAIEVVGRNCRFLQGPDTDPAAAARLRDALAAGVPCTVELVNYRKDGTAFWNELSISPVRDDAGRLTHFVGVQTDVTARRRLEEQLRQAQKMEAIGLLAGGVAHDFNNLLTVISGYGSLLLEGLPDGDPGRPAVTAILEAGGRAAALTTQLLAFSRRSVLAPRVVDPNAVVAETAKMLRRLIGEDVALELALAPGVSRIRVDPGQFGQVLMNLAVNARDAMPTGGKLTVETRDAELGPDSARPAAGVAPGRYVLTAVTDTGTGMPPDVRARVFEPFFTTKGPGRGTGLGLATVYGIVQQSGGHVEVYSEVGVGTTLKVYLPAADEAATPTPEAEPVRVRGGTEAVLVVEDQAEVRGLAAAALRAHGYEVLEAADGPTALALLGRPEARVDLLVTDVVMPGMSGRQLAEAARGLRPGLRVLFVSGYTDDAVVRHGILQAEVAFLQKPYTAFALTRKVREVLDAAP